MARKILFVITVLGAFSFAPTTKTDPPPPNHSVNWPPVCNNISNPQVVQWHNAYKHVKNFGEKWHTIAQMGGSLFNAQNERSAKIASTVVIDTPTCAFRFHIDDMINAFGISGQVTRERDRIRAYMGIDPISNRVHLYFVPITTNVNGRFVDAPFQCGGEFFVLDLTTPCPKTCGSARGVLKDAFVEGFENGPDSTTQKQKK